MACAERNIVKFELHNALLEGETEGQCRLCWDDRGVMG